MGEIEKKRKRERETITMSYNNDLINKIMDLVEICNNVEEINISAKNIYDKALEYINNSNNEKLFELKAVILSSMIDRDPPTISPNYNEFKKIIEFIARY